MNTPATVTQAFSTTADFLLREHAPSVAFQDQDTFEAEGALLNLFHQLPEGAIVLVDFSGVRIASEAARQLLKRVLLRLRSGEISDRFLVLGDLGDSHYNVNAMLVRESLTAVERRNDEGPELIGVVDPAVQSTYAYLLEAGLVTANAVQTHFNLNNVSTATNRLTGLAKLALARRVERRPVAGGGREYVYAAVQ